MCMYVCMYIHIYVYTHAYIHTYIHTYIHSLHPTPYTLHPTPTTNTKPYMVYYPKIPKKKTEYAPPLLTAMTGRWEYMASTGTIPKCSLDGVYTTASAV